MSQKCSPKRNEKATMIYLAIARCAVLHEPVLARWLRHTFRIDGCPSDGPARLADLGYGCVRGEALASAAELASAWAMA
jgi:hypothetical protein